MSASVLLMSASPARRGRVALLGDSMHSMGVTGVGIGLAVEDALVLAHHIGEKGLVSDALVRSCVADAMRQVPQMKRVILCRAEGKQRGL